MLSTYSSLAGIGDAPHTQASSIIYRLKSSVTSLLVIKSLFQNSIFNNLWGMHTYVQCLTDITPEKCVLCACQLCMCVFMHECTCMYLFMCVTLHVSVCVLCMGGCLHVCMCV